MSRLFNLLLQALFGPMSLGLNIKRPRPLIGVKDVLIPLHTTSLRQSVQILHSHTQSENVHMALKAAMGQIPALP